MSDVVLRGAGTAGVILSRMEQAVGRPLRAMIEISDRCNEVCVHCYQEQGQKGEMTTEQIKAIMDELAAQGVLVLTISGGEATLRKDFLELVGHARKNGFLVRIFTNGLTMTRELAAALAEHAVHVVEISLYSHRAETHDFVTGVSGSFEKTTNGIRHLVAAGVGVHVKTNVTSLNEHELHEYASFVEALGARYAFDIEPLMPSEGRAREPQMWNRSAESYERIMRDRRFKPNPVPVRPDRRREDTTLCGAGDYLLVEPNGELRPCTMLDLNLGNAATEGLGALRRNNEAYRGLVALRWRDAHGCRTCDLAGYCSRCHAASLAEVGDALGPYPSACERARTHYALATGSAPEIRAADGRDPALGPYARVGEHAFEAVADEITAEDDALAARLGWVRRAQGGLPAVQPAKPGQLVQLRRPGRKRERLERVPDVQRRA